MQEIDSTSEFPKNLLSGFPVVITKAVEWGEQDSFGHVNNTVYLKWCEAARVDYLCRIGMWKLIAEEQKGPILAAQSCNYRRPVDYPDTIHVGARITRIGNSSFVMEHIVVSEERHMVVAESDSTLVFYDYAESHPLPIPGYLREAICEMEGKKL